MRIAQVAPLFENVPPKAYGGTERVISTLTDGLTWAGHEVTLFATRESRADAEIVPCRDRPIGSGLADSSENADHVLELEEVLRRADQFDVIHFHTRFQHFPMIEHLASRTVTTCHNRVDLETLGAFYRRFRACPLIAISEAQRRTAPGANWAATIHHGYPPDQYACFGGGAERDGYLAFLGRICPEKGILDAIEIAEASGRPLKIAARINAVDRDYWEGQVRPRVDGKRIEYVGEVRETDKTAFLNGAAALVFPIRWPEPFGLVLIEAMACGVPCIAFRCGSVPEVLEDGLTGTIVDTVEEAVQAVERIGEFDRARIRKRFEERFSAERMVRRHVALYERIVRRSRDRRDTSNGIARQDSADPGRGKRALDLSALARPETPPRDPEGRPSR